MLKILFIIFGLFSTSQSFAQEQCPPGQHNDPSMGGMCMPNECPPGEAWDTGMNMCMPGTPTDKVTKMFHYNQFLIYTEGQGPRGRDAFSAPNMWMLMVNKKISDRHELGLTWMGTTDKWSIPSRGIPQLLQTGEANKNGVPYLDGQHPHSSPIMGLTFSDILTLGEKGQHKLTFFFAPRGEATAGPEAFMHRESAVGNPDAPLGHHTQDVFHISSTVIGSKLQINNKTTLEASTFSGVEPSPQEVDLDMHNPDSYAFRVNHKLSDEWNIGGSYAKVKALDRGIGPQEIENEKFYSGWINTSHIIKSGKLNTSTIWAQVKNRHEDLTLNSYLEEVVYQLGKNNFFGRVEVLQRTPEELEILVTDGSTGAKWVKALTLGYERRISERSDRNLFFGVAATKNYLTNQFQSAYGDDPLSGKVYLRITGKKDNH